MRKKRVFKQMRTCARGISILLIAALLSEELPGSGNLVMAALQQEEVGLTEDISVEEVTSAADGTSLEDETGVSEDIAAEKEPQILFELKEQRQAYGKQYRLSDGTVMATDYGMDVHYQDEHGEWEDIDNRFMYEAADAEDEMEGFATAEGAVEFKFAPDAVDGDIVRATVGEYSVGFEFLADTAAVQTEPLALDIAEEDAAAVPITFIKGEILNESEMASGLAREASSRENILSVSEEKASGSAVTWYGDWSESDPVGEDTLVEQAELDHVVTSVGYGNVFPGISLQYVTYGSSLKEYILVNEKQETYQYVFVSCPRTGRSRRMVLRSPTLTAKRTAR